MRIKRLRTCFGKLPFLNTISACFEQVPFDDNEPVYQIRLDLTHPTSGQEMDMFVSVTAHVDKHRTEEAKRLVLKELEVALQRFPAMDMFATKESAALSGAPLLFSFKYDDLHRNYVRAHVDMGSVYNVAQELATHLTWEPNHSMFSSAPSADAQVPRHLRANGTLYFDSPRLVLPDGTPIRCMGYPKAAESVSPRPGRGLTRTKSGSPGSIPSTSKVQSPPAPDVSVLCSRLETHVGRVAPMPYTKR